METRRLGHSPLQLTPIAFGGNVFGWTIDESRSFAVLDTYVAAGGNCIDTADVYATWAPGNRGGESETIIGEWMKRRENRHRVIVATKVGAAMGPQMNGLSPAYIRRAVEDSLRRLQTDYIDLYQAHRDDPITPLEDTLTTFDALIREGKVRAIGASNYTAERIAEALAVSRRLGIARYESVQPLYNLYDRAEYETHLEPLCAREELGVIPYSALASGFLTGKYRSERDLAQSPRGQGVANYLDDRGLRILDALDQLSHRYHASPATIALAWLIARPSVTAPIASATSRDQVHDLVAAVALRLDRDAIDLLDRASAYRGAPVVVHPAA